MTTVRTGTSGGLLWAATLWLGLVGGIAEATVMFLGPFFGHDLLNISPFYAWTIPMTSAVYAGLTGALLAALGRRRSGWPWRALMTLGATVACLGPALALPRLHLLAAIVLAIGVAFQVGRAVAGHPRGTTRLIRRTWPWLVAWVVVVAVVGQWRPMRAERRAVAALPQASAGAPNVLLVVLDTVRAEDLSLYGYGRRTTPSIEALGRQGVVFERAFSAAPWTLPSHATMFTGRWPHELSANWRVPLDAAAPTLAEVLQAHGYRTAGFVANVVEAGARHGIGRGFQHYDDFRVSAAQAIVDPSLTSLVALNERVRWALDAPKVINRKRAADVNGEFLRWLDGAGRAHPFFAFLNYMDGHESYAPPAPFDTAFGPARRRLRFWHTRVDAFLPQKWLLNPSIIQTEHDTYDGAIAYMDSQVGALMDELRARGVLDHTIVIVTADHGEQFGEHGLFGHGNGLYRQLLQVPLVVSYPPAIPSGVRVGRPATLRDLSATVLDLTGIPPSLPGASLARDWRAAGDRVLDQDDALLSEVSARDFDNHPWYPITLGDMVSIVSGGFHYIRTGDGAEQLFSIDDDPLELHDLSASAGARAELQRLRARTRAMAGPSEFDSRATRRYSPDTNPPDVSTRRPPRAAR
jgi:arylsulfatase A-like enzyme